MWPRYLPLRLSCRCASSSPSLLSPPLSVCRQCYRGVWRTNTSSAEAIIEVVRWVFSLCFFGFKSPLGWERASTKKTILNLVSSKGTGFVPFFSGCSLTLINDGVDMRECAPWMVTRPARAPYKYCNYYYYYYYFPNSKTTQCLTLIWNRMTARALLQSINNGK